MGAKQNLKQYLELKGVSPARFYKETGLSNGFLNQGENMSSNNIEIIISIYPDLNLSWLITTRGEMLISSNAERKNAHSNAHPNAHLSNKKTYSYLELSKNNQVSEPPNQYGIKIHKDQLCTPPELLPKKANAVPYYNLPVSAGALGVLESDVYTTEPDGYLELPAFDGCEAVFPITGVSMEPLLSSGDLIGIRTIENLSRSWEFIQTDVIYLIITHEDRMIKFIEKATDEEFIVCKSPNAGSFKVFKGDILKLYRVKACVKKL